MPINSGYSFYEYAGDGVTTRFPVQFSLGELKRAYVTCRVDNEVDAFGAPLYREITDVPGDPGMIEVLGSVPAVGAPIVFRRIVPKELLLHLYANGSILDYPSLDESHLQLMMALHEVLDGYGLTSVFTDINMNGYKLTNIFTDPDDPTSIATVGALGPYRQDALDAAIAAAGSALEALGYRDTALGYRDTALAHATTATTQADIATAQAGIASGHADAAALSVVDAQTAADSIGVMQSRGVLLTGQDTITLTWAYNPALKNVAVYLNGVKQDADTALIYTDINTITLTEPVTATTNWEVISVTLAGDSTLSGYVDQCQTIVNNAALSNYPVGSLLVVTGGTPPAGAIESDGGLKSRAAYPDLWVYAQGSGNISVDDASWTNTQYSPGDGSTTFRVPSITSADGLVCIKAYDVLSDPNVLNAIAVVNDINRLESVKLEKEDLNVAGNAPMYVARWWVVFDGTVASPNIKASGNVSSVTKNGTGDYTITFSTPMNDANYAIFGSVQRGVTNSIISLSVHNTDGKSVNSVRIQVFSSTTAVDAVDIMLGGVQ
jgi:hypothetical protein